MGTPVFGNVGFTVIAIALGLIGFQASTGMSWLDIAEYLGRGIHRLVGWTMIKIDTAREQIAARKHERELAKVNEVRVEKRSESIQPKALRKVPEIKPAVKEIPKAAPVRQKSLFKPTTVGELPDLDLLDEKTEDTGLGYSPDSLEAMSRQLELKLAKFSTTTRFRHEN